MTIGNRIKRVRKALDLTQTEFAERIGSVQNTVTGYESGRRNPSAPVISLICREFNVSETWLTTGAGEMFEPTPETTLDLLAAEYRLTDMEKQILLEFIRLDDRDRQGVIEYVRRLAVNNAFRAEPEPSIEEQVELYRQQLLLEQERASQASSGSGSSAG